ncbi:MAG: hypothetical protein V2I67_19730 [Thermoanaerobaculales bacterium]|jgi:hypothetical protein|nr:hypothetical protein [Thermoanaerobaculales bacterium]
MGACQLVVFGAIGVLATASMTRAAPCPVPTGSHPTIQAAVDDPGCTEITLGSQIYVQDVTIDRTLGLSGVSSSATVIAGRVAIEGASAVVTLAELSVDGSHQAVAGCFVEAVDVGGGARMLGSNIVVVNSDGDACLLFGDDFEDGTTGAWGNTVP